MLSSARDIEFAFPQELSREQAIALARGLVRSEFVGTEMIADLNVHWEPENPHVHVMLTMRKVTADGFGAKVTAWNKVSLLREWRESWADLANEHLFRQGTTCASITGVTRHRAWSWSRPATSVKRSKKWRRAASMPSG